MKEAEEEAQKSLGKSYLKKFLFHVPKSKYISCHIVLCQKNHTTPR